MATPPLRNVLGRGRAEFLRATSASFEGLRRRRFGSGKGASSTKRLYSSMFKCVNRAGRIPAVSEECGNDTSISYKMESSFATIRECGRCCDDRVAQPRRRRNPHSIERGQIERRMAGPKHCEYVSGGREPARCYCLGTRRCASARRQWCTRVSASYRHSLRRDQLPSQHTAIQFG